MYILLIFHQSPQQHKKSAFEKSMKVTAKLDQKRDQWIYKQKIQEKK